MTDYKYDICVHCGAKSECSLWCEDGVATECCEKMDWVHAVKCDECSNLIGLVMDDDYCGPERLICPSCMKKYGKEY